DGALGEGPVEKPPELSPRRRRAPAVPAERERRPEDDREGQLDGRVLLARDDGGFRHAQPGRPHRLTEELAVLRAPDHVGAGADQADRVEITPPWHTRPPPPSGRAAARHRAAPGRPRGGIAPTAPAATESRGPRPSRRRATRA